MLASTHANVIIIYYIFDTLYNRPFHPPLSSGDKMRSEWTKIQEKYDNISPTSIWCYCLNMQQSETQTNKEKIMHQSIESHPVLSSSSRAILSLHA